MSIYYANEMDEYLAHHVNYGKLAVMDAARVGLLAASQGVQTSQIISELMPKAPIPAYVVKNPYCTCEQATSGTATA